MAITNDLSYPFDPTGTLASNLISNEQAVITAVNYRDYHFFVPRLAPFFLDSMQITIKDSVTGAIRPLVKGIDWYGCFEFISASRACAKPVWGGVYFLDTNLTGVISMTYQTLGGVWTLDEAKIAELLAYSLHNPRVTAWEEVADPPYAFPPIDHEWDLVDMVGMSDVVTALQGVEDAIRASGGGDITAHINDFDNPHRTTAAQVGLGNVANYPIATNDQAAAMTSDLAYMTPAKVYQALYGASGPGTGLANHLADTGNPHHVTAHQAGTYTSAEIDAFLAGKIGATDTAYDTQRFNGRDQNAYAAWVLANGSAANALKFGGLTPAEFTESILGGKAADSDKLAGYTYAEVISNALAGKAADTFAFNGMDAATYAAWALQQGTAGDSAKFGGQTPAEFTASVLTGTAANSTLFGGLTVAQLSSQIVSQVEGDVTFASTTGEVGTSYWREIGRQVLPSASNPANSFGDIHWVITGGESNGATASGAYYLHINAKGSSPQITGELIQLSGTDSNIKIGWTISNIDQGDGNGAVPTLRVWLNTGPNMNSFTISSFSKDKVIYPPGTWTTTEPTSIAYFTQDAFALSSQLSQVVTGITETLNNITQQLSQMGG
jgi:hypothetical protein